MEVLFHFIAELIKISILGSIYATIALLIFRSVGNSKPQSWYDRVSKNKLRFWLLSGFIISVGLFAFMFTHFGDHGLGDSARVPIGHFRDIKEVNGTQAYIYDKQERIHMLAIDKFFITDDFVYGQMSSHNENYEGNFFLYDLVKNELKTYELKSEFEIELTKNDLDHNVNYNDFRYHYRQYWGGWRLWLLP